MDLHFKTRTPWRSWLERNHDSGIRELWLVFFKKHTGKPSISYAAAVEEALCFGWIDSIIKKLDDDRYARKFTPRTNDAKWSAVNLKRVEKLEAQGRMTEAGRAKIAKGVRPEVPPARLTIEMPQELTDALEKNRKAREFFDQLAPSYRKHYIGWIASAKREETRAKRVREAIGLLKQRKKLGLK